MSSLELHDVFEAVANKRPDQLSRLLTQRVVDLNTSRVVRGQSSSPLTDAIECGDIESVRMLLDADADPNYLVDQRLPLHVAVDCQRDDMVALLLARGADPNKCNTLGFGALHVAALRRCLSIARRLVDGGASLDLRTGNELSALHLAVSIDSVDVAQLLLDNGAHVDARDRLGMTPLMSAPSASMTMLLLSRGADVAATAAQQSCVDFAAAYGRSDVQRCLLAFGAEPRDCPGNLRAAAQLHRKQFVRNVAFTVALGLQPLQLPAFVTLSVVDAALEPFHDVCSMHFKWTIITAVKHFRQRAADAPAPLCNLL